MSATAIAATLPPLRWGLICELHPDQWVCLHDVETGPDGSVDSARVLGHDRSMRELLAHVGAVQPDTIVMHTSGRRLHPPRIEMTDEIRDVIRSRR